MMSDIKCCPKCDKPVVWTFMFPGAEWFCLFCKWQGGLFYAERRDHTPELVELRDKITKEFKKLVAHYIPPTSYRKGCDKCPHEYHINHVTKVVRTRSKNAYQKLMNWKDFKGGGVGKI